MQLSPYFESLSKQKRICPECLSRPLRVEPSETGYYDSAFDVCDCGYSQVRIAPEEAMVGGRDESVELPERSIAIKRLNDDLRREREAKKQARIIELKFD